MVGTVLNNRYKLLKELGAGGFATVYAGLDLQKNRQVAIKVTNDIVSRNQEQLKAFMDELRALSSLPEHPNIIKIHDYGLVGEKAFLVMDYAPLGTLEELLEKSPGKPLEFPQAGRLFVQMANALGHAHNYKVVHRDIKPENFLFLAKDQLVVSDFGLARPFRSQMTQSINLFGSPPYVSPERWADKVGPSSDVYALGIILYRMLVGSLPFQANDPLAFLQLHVYQAPPRLKDLRPDLPPGIDYLVSLMLAKQPENRPTAGELGLLYQAALKRAYPASLTTLYTSPVPIISPPPNSQPFQGIYNSGKISQNPAEPLAAIRQLTEIIDSSPPHPGNFMQRAREYVRFQNYGPALEDYNQAEILDPRNPVIFFERGKVLADTHRLPEALADLTRAIKLAPHYPDPYEKRGDIHFGTQQWTNAVNDYERALHFKNVQPDVFNKLGLALRKRAENSYSIKLYGEAVKDYTRAIRLDPRDPLLYKNRGKALQAQNNHSRAISDFNRALKLDHRGVEIYHNLAEAYLARNQYRKAVNLYNEALKNPGWNGTTLKNRGYANFCLQKYKRALDDFNEAIKLNPQDPDLFHWRGNTYFATKNYALALKDYDEALRLNPGNNLPLFNRAVALAALGRVTEAVRSLHDQLQKAKNWQARKSLRGVISQLEISLNDHPFHGFVQWFNLRIK